MGGLEGRPVIDADCEGRADVDGLPEMEADRDGRDADDGEAEGQIKEPAGQSTRDGSQHTAPVLFDPLVYFALGDGVKEGQIFIVDVHCILVGSQHPPEGDIGEALALTSRKIIVAEGDGVIIPARTSEHSVSPGVHEPLEGSQHRIPLILVSPRFVCATPAAIAARKRRRRNMFALLLYDLFLEILNILNFLKIYKFKVNGFM